MKRLLGLLTALLLLPGCITYSTESTEVGVHVNMVTGLDPEVYDPGGTYFFAPLITDWYTYSTQSHTLTMVADPNMGDRQGRDDLEFKTADGNDVAVDVTVIYHIVAQKAPTLLQHVARNDDELKDRIMRPVTRSVIRDALNRLSSEDIYAGKKFAAAEKAKEALNNTLEEYGVMVDNVVLGDHRFNKAYQQAINDKKVYDQQVNTYRSKSENVQREWEAKLEQAKGQVEQLLAQENGRAAQLKLEADAYYISKQKSAEAIIAEKQAKAEGITKMNEALAGSGGRIMVKRRVAEVLKGKRIVVLPGGGSGDVGLQKLDVNELVKAYTAKEAVDGKSQNTATNR